MIGVLNIIILDFCYYKRSIALGQKATNKKFINK